MTAHPRSTHRELWSLLIEHSVLRSKRDNQPTRGLLNICNQKKACTNESRRLTEITPPGRIHHGRGAGQPTRQNDLASWLQPAFVISYPRTCKMSPQMERWRLCMGPTAWTPTTMANLATATSACPTSINRGQY